MNKQVLLYVPVIHAGYLNFLGQHPDATQVLLLGRSFWELWRPLQKEIRALDPHTAAGYLRSSHRAPNIRVVEQHDLLSQLAPDGELVLPDEDIMRDLAERFGLGESHQLRFERTFLRWDRAWSLAQPPVNPDIQISTEAVDREFLSLAAHQASRSSDWWRQVGAVAIAADKTLLLADRNRHLPSDYSPYINGDPRNNFKRGQHIDLSTAIHAEAAVIARAARQGLSLAGAQLYVTTFPCPPCARLIAESGITTCYFAGPYAMLDGEDILRQAGVQLVWVDLGTQ